MQRLRLEIADELLTPAIRKQGLGRSWFWPSAAAVTVGDFSREIFSRYNLNCPGGPAAVRLVLTGFTLPPEAPIGLLRDGDLIAVQQQQQQQQQQQEHLKPSLAATPHAVQQPQILAQQPGAVAAAPDANGAPRGGSGRKRKRGGAAGTVEGQQRGAAAGSGAPQGSAGKAARTGEATQQQQVQARAASGGVVNGAAHGHVAALPVAMARGAPPSGASPAETAAVGLPSATPGLLAAAAAVPGGGALGGVTAGLAPGGLATTAATAVTAEGAVSDGEAEDGAGAGVEDGQDGDGVGAASSAKRASRNARRKAAKRRLMRTGVLPYKGSAAANGKGAAPGVASGRVQKLQSASKCGRPQKLDQQQRRQQLQDQKQAGDAQRLGKRGTPQAQTGGPELGTPPVTGAAASTFQQQLTAELVAAAMVASPLDPNGLLCNHLQQPSGQAPPIDAGASDRPGAALEPGACNQGNQQQKQQRQQQEQQRKAQQQQKQRATAAAQGKPQGRAVAAAGAGTGAADGSGPGPSSGTAAPCVQKPAAKREDSGDEQSSDEEEEAPVESSSSDSSTSSGDADDSGDDSSSEEKDSGIRGKEPAKASSSSDTSSESSSSSSSSSSDEDTDSAGGKQSGSTTSSSSSSSDETDSSSPPPPQADSGPQGAQTGGRASAGAPLCGGAVNAAAPDYDALPPVQGRVCVGDVLAYKLLEIGADMCPRVSGWRQCRVTALESGSGVLVLQPHPNPRVHPLQQELDALRARMAAEAAEEDAETARSADRLELQWDSLPFPTEYREDGVLALPLDAFADVRFVSSTSPVGSGAAQAAAATNMGTAACTASKEPEAERPRAGRLLSSAAATPPNPGPPRPSASKTPAANGAHRPPRVVHAGVHPRPGAAAVAIPAAGPAAAVGAGAQSPRPPPGAIVAAVGGWADIAAQLRQRRQELVNPSPAPSGQEGRPQNGEGGTPPPSVPEVTVLGFSKHARAYECDTRKPSQATPNGAEKRNPRGSNEADGSGGGAAGVQVPGAVRPRGGARRTALGPTLALLRNNGGL